MIHSMQLENNMTNPETCTIRIFMPMGETVPPPSAKIRSELMSTNLLCRAQKIVPNDRFNDAPLEMVQMVTTMMDDLTRTLHFGDVLMITDTSELLEELTGPDDGVYCVEGSVESDPEKQEIHALMLLNYFSATANRGVYGFDDPIGLIWVRPCGDYSVYARNGDRLDPDGGDA